MSGLTAQAKKYVAVLALLVFFAILAVVSDNPADAQESANSGFGIVVGYLATVLFFDVGGIPIVVMVLVLGALFFTFRFTFINLRGVGHAVAIVSGKYDDPNDVGEVSHFQALSSALSATVGLGNIAGVALAVSVGGPGAVFWMMLTAFFGMTSKFAECTLGQM